jgi:transposase
VLGYANTSEGSSGFCRARGPAVPGGAAVWPGPVAGECGPSVGVRRATAHRWYHAWRAEGREALRAAGRAGRKPRLDRRQWARIAAALLQGPTAHGFATELWTLPRIATVIVRRTWAPRGQPPVLHDTGANWKRLSIAAALGFRWDGRRTRLYFQTRPGTYTDTTLISFLRALKRHFRGQRIVLIWDGLGAHNSGRMRAYLAAPRSWLRVERLPAYAPDLNPVKLLWGNLKARELANLCPADIEARRLPVRAGCARSRRASTLALAFLQHADLGFDPACHAI